MKGGRQIASGTYGCVFKPQLLCKGETTRGNGVSKLMEKKEAVIEIGEQNYVDTVIDPEFEFHLQPPIMCEIGDIDTTTDDLTGCHLFKGNIPEDVNDKFAILQMRDGGMSMLDYFKKMSSRPHLRNVENAMKFILGMENLFYGVEGFVKNQFLHLDIKPANIVYNESENRFNFIDFGLSVKSDNIDKVLKKRRHVFELGYFVTPIEISFIANDDVNVEIADEILEQLEDTYNNPKSSYRRFSKNYAASDIYLEPLIPSIERYKPLYIEESQLLRIDMVDKIDVFSLGIVLLETLAAFSQFKFDFNNTGFYQVEFYRDIAQFIKKLIEPFCKDRLSATEALMKFREIKHKYLGAYITGEDSDYESSDSEFFSLSPDRSTRLEIEQGTSQLSPHHQLDQWRQLHLILEDYHLDYHRNYPHHKE